jgi:hypothetical protein
MGSSRNNEKRNTRHCNKNQGSIMPSFLASDGRIRVRFNYLVVGGASLAAAGFSSLLCRSRVLGVVVEVVTHGSLERRIGSMCRFDH